MTCPHITVTDDVGVDSTVTDDAAAAVVITGDVFGVGLSSGPVSCCQEGVIQSGVIYNGQWSFDDSITFSAAIGA